MALYGGSMNQDRKKVILIAPLLTRSGYGEQSRFALRALRSREDLFDIYVKPLEWGKTSWISLSDKEREWIDHRIERTIHHANNGGTFDISLQVTIPNEWSQAAPINIGYTAGIETTKCAHEWLQAGNLVDKIIVVSNHSKDVFEHTTYEGTNEQTGQKILLKLETDVSVVNYPVKNYEKLEPLELDLHHDFNFVCIAQMGPRKNLDNTIKWFLEEFKNDNVGLIVKTNLAKNCQMDRELAHGRMQAVIRETKKQMDAEDIDTKCKVYLIHGDMTDEEMHSIYLNEKVRASLLLTHGEGFGLPLFESAYMGVPVVATDWSGQQDFLYDEDNKPHFYQVAYDIQQVPQEIVWESVIVPDSMWAFPRESSAKEQMRQCYEDLTAEGYDGTKYCDYSSELKERFEEQKMYAEFISALNVSTPLPKNPLGSNPSDIVELD
jgi:glycosyltransferase involved in cell wall biosynthesis